MTNMPRRIAVAGAVLAATVSGTVFAQSPADEIARNAQLQRRIQQGVAAGDLSGREAARLEARQARIERVQARALSDGRFTPGEERRIDAMQQRQSQAIRAERTDAERGNPGSAWPRHMHDGHRAQQAQSHDRRAAPHPRDVPGHSGWGVRDNRFDGARFDHDGRFERGNRFDHGRRFDSRDRFDHGRRVGTHSWGRGYR